ncbi:hypothetical protein DNU06_00485 [Putridiphycobacter roseus]|uniref:NodB homology domain-containing protein n=1 Tax=Putridiphycobacter roseus TaxID=2219161 RepID=A0A2W1NKF3_9FLAO|nr:hypothetical protein [Putridiphycobacter roseus]PZE18346.1 hypothetical protein DNU06_00485 [Putridiphycobacter roseus]
MQLYLTYDYELYFGTPTGSVQKSILAPTNTLREIAKRTGAKMVFFIDVGYLKALKHYAHFPAAIRDYQAVVAQIKLLVEEGHDCQLHIHPHWEDCQFNGESWDMDVRRYKLSDFNTSEIESIVLEYQSILKGITGKPVTVYRAGGWCLQPFSKMEKAFKKAGLRIDSTVFPGGKNTIAPYYYDFTEVPNKAYWHFENDLTLEVANGSFIEVPIGSFFFSKWFFWKLFILGRLFPKNHKPLGDGYPVPSVGMRKEMLTKGKLLAANTEGYFITKANAMVKAAQLKQQQHLVFIAHPKAMTNFSLKKLEKVIVNQQAKGNVFALLSDFKPTSD